MFKIMAGPKLPKALIEGPIGGPYYNNSQNYNSLSVAIQKGAQQ